VNEKIIIEQRKNLLDGEAYTSLFHIEYEPLCSPVFVTVKPRITIYYDYDYKSWMSRMGGTKHRCISDETWGSISDRNMIPSGVMICGTYISILFKLQG
jgi:hypothetical protein